MKAIVRFSPWAHPSVPSVLSGRIGRLDCLGLLEVVEQPTRAQGVAALSRLFNDALMEALVNVQRSSKQAPFRIPEGLRGTPSPA